MNNYINSCLSFLTSPSGLNASFIHQKAMNAVVFIHQPTLEGALLQIAAKWGGPHNGGGLGIYGHQTDGQFAAVRSFLKVLAQPIKYQDKSQYLALVSDTERPTTLPQLRMMTSANINEL